jgi:hypothetical protein
MQHFFNGEEAVADGQIAASRTPRAHERLRDHSREPISGLRRGPLAIRTKVGRTRVISSRSRLGRTPCGAGVDDRGFDWHSPTLGRVGENVPVDAGCEAGVGVAHVRGDLGDGAAFVDQ